MQNEPEAVFLASRQFLGAVNGTRMGLAAKGYATDDDTTAMIAMATIIAFADAGGMDEKAVSEFVAMIQSMAARMNAPQH